MRSRIRTRIALFIAGMVSIGIVAIASAPPATADDATALRGVRLSLPDNLTAPPRGAMNNYRALLIGINDYQHWPKLQTAVNDVRALESLLIEKYHFSPDRITTLIDDEATAQRIIDTFKELNRTLNRKDALLIYYAGHGYLDEFDVGSWVPVDAQENALNQYLATDRIHRIVAKLSARHIFLVADACFSGSLLATRGSPLTDVHHDRFFTHHVQRMSRQVLASGGLETVADLGPDNHSIFAYHFLRELTLNDQPFFSASELSAQVAKLVTRNGEQTPQWSRLRNTGDENGEFFFLQTTRSPPPPPEDALAKRSHSPPITHDNPIGATQPVQHTSNQASSRIDLQNGYIEVIAVGTADIATAKNPVQAELIALKSARHLGYGKLVEALRGVNVGGAAQYHKAMLDNDILAIESAGSLHGVEVIDETMTWAHDIPKASVTLRLALAQPATPPSVTHQGKLTTANIADTLQDYSGVIIDARHLPLTHARPLNIVSSNAYHTVTTIDPAKVIDTTRYANVNVPAHNPSPPDNRGNSPLVIRAQALQGRNGLIVTEHEAALINDHNRQQQSSSTLSDIIIVY